MIYLLKAYYPKYFKKYNPTRKKYNIFKKWTKILSKHVSKEDIPIDNNHVKRCSTSLIIRKMQIKTTLKYHLIFMRMATIKNQR